MKNLPQWKKPFTTVLISTTVLVTLSTLSALAQVKVPRHASPKSGTANIGATTSNTPLFLPVVTYSSGGTGASSVAVADVNGDGKPDLVVANICASDTDCSKGTVAVLLGNGDGTFQTAVTYGSGGQGATSVAVGDLNGDGKPDLAVANAGSPHVGVLLGNGDGTFQTVQRYPSGGFGTSSVAIADVNGDGKLDLVIVNCGTCGLQEAVAGVLLGNGDGTFEPVRTMPLQQYYSRSIAVADVNGDGKPDLVVSFFESCPVLSGCETGGVGVLLGNGDGTFQPVQIYNSRVYAVSVVAVADLNGNGRPDVVVGGSCLTFSPCLDLGVLLGNGDHTFQPAAVYGSGGVNVLSVAVADVNGDGKPDLLVANECPFSDCFNKAVVGVLPGNGDGTFQRAITFSSGGYLAHEVAVGDVNGDGRPDVVVVDLCSGEFSCDNEDGTVGGLGLVGVLLNNTPFCTTPPVITVSTSAVSLWPPNGKMVPVTVSGTITDTGCTVKRAAYAVTDEYGQVQPRGSITLGAGGSYSFTTLLQASRLGTDLGGRQYTVTVRASDNAGNAGSASAVVTVPHDQRR
jgi:FG-GAP-like repeat